MPSFVRIVTLSILLAFSLSACETIGSVFSGDEEEKTEDGPQKTAQELYDAGKAKMDEERFKAAIKDFEEIERLYPFDPLATKAQLMTAFSYYQDLEYEDAIGVMDAFIRLHPGNEEVAYVYYLKALCYYERIADVKRDQAVTQQALEALQEVIQRFPDSQYARDAKLKIDLVNDHLAGKEMEIGRFYLKQKKYVAAINRFRKVIDEYQTTSHTEEALYRNVEAYLLLGLTEEAQKNAAVLGHNYPYSKWYKYAYNLVAEGKDSPKLEKSWVDNIVGESEPKKPLPHDDNAKTWLDKALEAF